MWYKVLSSIGTDLTSSEADGVRRALDRMMGRRRSNMKDWAAWLAGHRADLRGADMPQPVAVGRLIHAQ